MDRAAFGVDETKENTGEALHNKDKREGYGEVYLTYTLARKYPNVTASIVGSSCFPPQNPR